MVAVLQATAFHRPAGPVTEDVWVRIARSYATFSSPFVPCREDVAAYECAVARYASAHGTGVLQAVMLGVTPGVALMSWPKNVRMIAVEISRGVIDALWPGDVPGAREAICASWLSVPMAAGSCDVVVGDGSLSTCRFPGDVRSLAAAVRDLLVDDGIFVVRSYVRPQMQESTDEVFDALFSAAGMSVDCFKMRLYLAMQRSAQQGVAVRDAAKVLGRYDLNPRTMQERLGWSRASVEPFEAWPASDAIYSFPSLGELREVLGEFFTELSVTFPTYELGHCCPVLAMRPKPLRRV